MPSDRHAYLIIAHEEPELLKTLIYLLDDRRNDIFLHIDKKSERLYAFACTLSPRFSTLHVLNKRIDVSWGHFSQVETEFLLIEAALSAGNYAYIHLLSGADLPLKSQDEIHAFFQQHNGKEFVGFASGERNERDLFRKACLKQILIRHLTRGPEFMQNLCLSLNRKFLRLQTLVGYRKRYPVELKKGTNWFSITGNLAAYMASKKPLIRKYFKHVLCADEMFLQTIIWNSPFKESVYNLRDEYDSCRRFMIWGEASPRILGIEDERVILSSGRLFARKFSSCNPSIISTVAARCAATHAVQQTQSR